MHRNNKVNGFLKRAKKMVVAVAISGGILVGITGGFEIISFQNDSNWVKAATKANKTETIKVDQRVAVNKFNQKYKNAQISEIDLEKDNGSYQYSIKGHDKVKEYEIKVNAQNGKVVRTNSEKLDNEDSHYALNLSKTISREEASQIAEKAAKKGTSIEWTLEQTNKNKAIWNVKVKDGQTEKEVTINARSKKVLKSEND